MSKNAHNSIQFHSVIYATKHGKHYKNRHLNQREVREHTDLLLEGELGVLRAMVGDKE